MLFGVGIVAMIPRIVPLVGLGFFLVHMRVLALQASGKSFGDTGPESHAVTPAGVTMRSAPPTVLWWARQGVLRERGALVVVCSETPSEFG